MTNKSIIRKLFYNLINCKEYSLIDELINTKIEFKINQRKFEGRDVFRELLKLYLARYPKTHTEILAIICEGDMVSVHWEIVVLIPKNSEPFHATGITNFRIRDEKIIQLNQFWDASNLDMLL